MTTDKHAKKKNGGQYDHCATVDHIFSRLIPNRNPHDQVLSCYGCNMFRNRIEHWISESSRDRVIGGLRFLLFPNKYKLFINDPFADTRDHFLNIGLTRLTQKLLPAQTHVES